MQQLFLAKRNKDVEFKKFLDDSHEEILLIFSELYVEMDNETLGQWKSDQEESKELDMEGDMITFALRECMKLEY